MNARALNTVSLLSNLMAVILTRKAAYLKWGFFPVYPAVEREREREEREESTFLLEIKPNCPFSLVVP